MLMLFCGCRDFKLNLDVDESVFHPEVEIVNSDGPVDYDTSRVLSGNLEGNP